MSDEQDNAESVDEEMLGTDAVTSDEVGAFDDAPDRPVGLPFADADVTDESFAARTDREEPEVLEDDPYLPLRLVEPASSSTPTCWRRSTKTATSPNPTDRAVDSLDSRLPAVATSCGRTSSRRAAGSRRSRPSVWRVPGPRLSLALPRVRPRRLPSGGRDHVTGDGLAPT